MRLAAVFLPALALVPIGLAASGCVTYAYDGKNPDAIECAAMARYMSMFGAANGVDPELKAIPDKLYAYYSDQAEKTQHMTSEAVFAQVRDRSIALAEVTRTQVDRDAMVDRNEPCLRNAISRGVDL